MNSTLSPTISNELESGDAELARAGRVEYGMFDERGK